MGHDVLYTDYGARLFEQLHPFPVTADSSFMHQAEMQRFIEDIAPVVHGPCDVGMHLRVYDSVKHVNKATPLYNLTYGFHFKPAPKSTLLTVSDLFRALQRNASFVKVMMPPVLDAEATRLFSSRHFKFIGSTSLFSAQKELASCKFFIGDAISSITTSILRMRQAAGMDLKSTLTLRSYLASNTRRVDQMATH